MKRHTANGLLCVTTKEGHHHMFKGKFIARLVGISLTMGLLCAAQASAQTPSPPTSSVRQAEEGEYVIIGGRRYGAKHGLTFETGSVEIILGGDPIVIIPGNGSSLDEDASDLDENADSSPISDGSGVMFGPQIYICSSYAVSTEYMQYMYHGVGLAAGDVCDFNYRFIRIYPAV